MKQYKTNFNAFEWRFPRTFKEATGYEYEVTLESPKKKRQRIWRATKVSIIIALSMYAWITYSLRTL